MPYFMMWESISYFSPFLFDRPEMSETSLNWKHIVFHLMRQPESRTEMWMKMRCALVSVHIHDKVQRGQHGLMDYCVSSRATQTAKTFLFLRWKATERPTDVWYVIVKGEMHEKWPVYFVDTVSLARLLLLLFLLLKKIASFWKFKFQICLSRGESKILHNQRANTRNQHRNFPIVHAPF